MMQLSMIIKKVSFGATGYSDFKVNQDWKDFKTAGFWAKNILWNKPTVEASVRDTNKKNLI